MIFKNMPSIVNASYPLLSKKMSSATDSPSILYFFQAHSLCAEPNKY